MKQILYLFAFILIATSNIEAQSYAFGLKGGPTVGFQTWNNTDRSPLFRYHGIAFIEQAPEDPESFVLFAQAGYHIKGSALRFTTFINSLGQNQRLPTTNFQFRNASLTAGVKQRVGEAGKYYYMFGIRGEYNINTNLPEEITSVYSSNFPLDPFVRKITYGLTLGAGTNFPISEFISGLFEFTINPDLAFQYMSPPFTSLNFQGQPTTIQERNIRNITMELTVGIRFLRKIEYVD